MEHRAENPIRIKLPNGKYLIAEINDNDYKEIYITLENENGDYQDIACVGADYTIDDNLGININNGKYYVRIWTDPNCEDWDNEHIITERREWE